MNSFLSKAILFFLLSISINAFSNNSEDFLSKANQLKASQDYVKAIRFYTKAIRHGDYKDAEIRDIYFKIADCFQMQGKEKMAFRVLKSSIYNYGATKEEIVNAQMNSYLKKKFLLEIDSEYNKYRSRYIAKQNDIDTYLNENNIVLK